MYLLSSGELEWWRCYGRMIYASRLGRQNSLLNVKTAHASQSKDKVGDGACLGTDLLRCTVKIKRVHGVLYLQGLSRSLTPAEACVLHIRSVFSPHLQKEPCDRFTPESPGPPNFRK